MKLNSVTIRDSAKNRFFVEAPYNPMFHSKIRKLGGQCVDPLTQRSWNIGKGQEDEVRRLCNAYFGTDTEDYNATTIRVDAYLAWSVDKIGERNVLYFAGRKILERRTHDKSIILGHGVSIHSGVLPKTGGTINKPSLGLTPDSNVELQISDVPIFSTDINALIVEVLDID